MCLNSRENTSNSPELPNESPHQVTASFKRIKDSESELAKRNEEANNYHPPIVLSIPEKSSDHSSSPF